MRYEPERQDNQVPKKGTVQRTKEDGRLSRRTESEIYVSEINPLFLVFRSSCVVTHPGNDSESSDNKCCGNKLPIPSFLF